MLHVRVGPMKADQLGRLVEVLAPYARHSTGSHVMRRAVRYVRGQPLVGPAEPSFNH